MIREILKKHLGSIIDTDVYNVLLGSIIEVISYYRAVLKYTTVVETQVDSKTDITFYILNPDLVKEDEDLMHIIMFRGYKGKPINIEKTEELIKFNLITDGTI